MKQAFIDVRTRQELEEMGMIKDALWVPITEMSQRLDEIEEFMKNNTDKKVFIHCRKGPRARLGASILMNKGLGPINVLDEILDEMREKLVPFKKESEL
jgi:rhodanese-related sulfurtransferase